MVKHVFFAGASVSIQTCRAEGGPTVGRRRRPPPPREGGGGRRRRPIVGPLISQKTRKVENMGGQVCVGADRACCGFCCRWTLLLAHIAVYSNLKPTYICDKRLRDLLFDFKPVHLEDLAPQGAAYQDCSARARIVLAKTFGVWRRFQCFGKT